MAERMPPSWWPQRGTSEFIPCGALRWHVQRAGPPDAPVALLLHGTGAATHSWRQLAPLLAQRWQVIAPDLPGHGFTQTPANHDLSLPAVARSVADLLRSWALQPSLVVGHSAGAAIAVRMALDGHVAPRAIASINGAILPLQGPVGRLFLPVARLMAANPLVAPAFAAWARLPTVTQRLLHSTGSRIDALGQRCYAHLVRDPEHAAGTLRLMASWDLTPLQTDLPLLKTPLLLITGDNDKTLSPAHAQRVAQQVRGTRCFTLRGLGHLAHEEDAAAVLAAVEAGLAGVTRGPSTSSGRTGRQSRSG